jgi:hypothetical protein
MNFWEHRAVQDKCDLEDLKSGRVRDDETPPEEMDRTRLSPRQMLALRAFHSGSSITDAAKAAGVTRQTLHRWRTIYHSFAEAMDVWEEGQMIIARSRLVDMADNAIDTLANVIADGNARAAMIVLRSLRILRTYAPLKPPAEEKMRSHDAAREQGAAREQANSRTPTCRDHAGAETVEPRQAGIALPRGQEKEGGDMGWKPVVQEAGKTAASDGKVAPNQHAPAKTAPAAAQPMNVISNPPVERPKTAILTGKAGLAIKKACDSALQAVTEVYQMLPNATGQDAIPRGIGLAS